MASGLSVSTRCYPTVPPQFMFTPHIKHAYVFPGGNVCLSLIQAGWKPAITLKLVLIGAQMLLDEPNMGAGCVPDGGKEFEDV